jgi:hypothetical protein
MEQIQLNKWKIKFSLVRIPSSLLFNEMSKRSLLFRRGISAYCLSSLSLCLLSQSIYFICPFALFIFVHWRNNTDLTEKIILMPFTSGVYLFICSFFNEDFSN